jgi:hypothetical protein
MRTLTSGGIGFSLESATRATVPQQVLDDRAADLFALFLEREQEFGFNPAVVVEYPEAGDPETSAFLNDPLAQIAARRAALAQDGAPIGRVLVLTTYADRLGPALVAAGYRMLPIDMPAGPDHTAAFIRDFPEAGETRRTLYLEAVNEADEKIRPAYALTMTDAAGRLCGGACGSLHSRNGRLYAYLATMSITAGLPPGTGTLLAGAMLDFFRDQGVAAVHLGTQTAGPFYEGIGFHVTHRLIPALRNRKTAEGRVIQHDLVMLEMNL